jgi:phosphate transport system protein
VTVVATRRDLRPIEDRVSQLFAMVGDGVAGATHAFLNGDKDAGRRLVSADEVIDNLQAEVEALVHNEFMAATPLEEDDLRLLLLVVRIVPELERSGDLVEHIAARSGQELARQLTPRCRGLLGEMGRLGAEMWRLAARAFAEHDTTTVDELALRDDELDDLHVDLTAEMAEGRLSVAVAIEMGLVARFFERLGDHAVNVVRRLSYLEPNAAPLSRSASFAE